jgi:transcriptional regulator with XRE-family HTH domain
MRQPVSPEAFGSFIKALREAVGLTLRAVEDKTNRVVKNGYLSQIEKGSINRPSPGILYELAQVYGVSYRELLVRAGHRVPEEQVAPAQQAVAGLPLHAFAELDEEDRQTLIEYAAFLRQRRKDRQGE